MESLGTIIFIGIGLTWMIGLNLLANNHLKRINVGSNEQTDLGKLVINLFNTFNKTEWLIFSLLSIFCFSGLVLAINL